MPIRITSRELKPNNPLKHLLKTTTKVVDMSVNQEERELDRKIEKATSTIIKEEVDTDLIKKLTKYGKSYDLVMSKLESMKKVDKYPSKAEQKVNKYSYQLFWPRDKTIGQDTILKSIIIQINYDDNLYSFFFPARQLAEHDRYKLDHFDTVVDSSGTPSNEIDETEDANIDYSKIPEPEFTIYDALRYYSIANSLDGDKIKSMFKRYKIITNDDYLEPDFNIKGHNIMVLYEKISSSKTIVNQHDSKSTETTETTPNTPTSTDVKIIEGPDPKEDITDDDLKYLNKYVSFKVPIGDQFEGGKFTDLIHMIKDKVIRTKVMTYFTDHPIIINGIDNDSNKLKELNALPYADRLIVAYLTVNNTDDRYNNYKSGQRNILNFDDETKKLLLFVYLDYSQLYRIFETDRQSTMTTRLKEHNNIVYDQYMEYIKEKNNPTTTTTTTTTTNPDNQ